MQHKALLFTFLLILPLLLQSGNADTKVHDRRIADNPYSAKFNPNSAKNSKKSISDQLLLVTPESSQKSHAFPAKTQEIPDQKGWFGRLKTMAKDSLNTAKETIYKAPEFVAEQASNIGDKAKRLSGSALNQATKLGHKVEQIYDQVVSKDVKTEINVPHENREKEEVVSKPHEKSGNDRGDPASNNDEPGNGRGDLEPNKEKGIFGRIKGKISDFSHRVQEKVKDVPLLGRISNKFKTVKETSQNSINSDSGESFHAKVSNRFNSLTKGVSQAWKNIQMKEKFVYLKENLKSIPEKISEKYTKLANQTESSTNWFKNSFNRVTQKFKQIVPEGTNKIGTLKNKISSVYQGIKNQGFPSVSNLFHRTKETISRFGGATFSSASNLFHDTKETLSRFGGATKAKFTSVLDQVTPVAMFPINSVINFGSWTWNLMAWRKLIYWIIGIVFTCLILKVLLFLLPFIQMTVSILKTPFQVMFMLNNLIRQFYPKEKVDAGAQRQRAESQVEENSAKYPKEKDRSYQRYSSSQEEWHRESQLHEPKVIKISDSEQAEGAARRFEEKQENEERYYNYYKCYGCNQQWENVTVGKGPVQECKNRNCRYSFGPYYQIPLLNNKQKKEKFESKVKME